MRTAGVVVLYNPDANVCKRIGSYLHQVETLYIITNSNFDLDTYLKEIILTGKIRIIKNHYNVGIATAYNQAISKGLEERFDFLLTMDQDSMVSENLVPLMLKEFEIDNRLGIICPRVIHEKLDDQQKIQNREYVNLAMSSGSIIRLSMVTNIGYFLDKLFIDYVDYEYSLRAKSAGFKILKLNTTQVIHNLGEITQKHFLFRKISLTNHLPFRYYYRTRNRLYVYKIYRHLFPKVISRDIMDFCKEIIKITLFEKQKHLKFYMIILGYWHFRNNLFGALKVKQNKEDLNPN